MDREKAARRIDAIGGFREEMRRLEKMRLLEIDAETRQAVETYHQEVLEELSDDYDLVIPDTAARWGLKLAAAGGALVLVGLGLAGLDLLWPRMADWARIATGIALPLVFLLLAEGLAAAGRDRLFVGLLAGLAALAFAFDLRILTAIFNRPFGFEHAVAAGSFAAALGHRYATALLSTAGLAIAGGALAALLALADGRLWPALFGRLDPVFGIGIALFVLGSTLPLDESRRADWRLAGLLLGGAAAIGLSHPGASLLPAAQETVAGLYQLATAVLLPLAVIAGLLRRWPETVYAALLLTVIFLFDRLEAWFDPVLPEALQALMLIAAVGLFAGLALLVRRIDRRLGEER